MMTCRDDAGRGLDGAIDGSNSVYRTSFPVRLDRPIEVFVNGLCRVADMDNGYDFTDTRTLRMREVLLVGDTLSVRYNTSQVAVSPPYAQPPRPTVIELAAIGPPTVTVDVLGPPTVRRAGASCCP